jgi:hypothetical protein
MAKTKQLSQLKEMYETCCNEYAKKFCNKYGFDFDGWVGGDVGGIITCAEYFFNFNDIVFDINTRQPRGTIIAWYDKFLDQEERYINYKSYSKGLR